MSEENKTGELAKLTGTISNYKCTRMTASFVFTDADRTKMGVVAIAAGLAGLSGPAIATAENATSTEEQADYVEFDLDGQPVKGWVWRSPFKEGDQVEVAAEWVDDHYETGGIARPSDRTIALYPHCSRGKTRHIKNAGKWWFLGATGALLYGLCGITVLFNFGQFVGDVGAIAGALMFWILLPLIWFFFGVKVASFVVALTLVIGGMTVTDWSEFLVNENGVAYGPIGVGVWYAFFGLMAFSLTRKWIPFVRLSEKVFRTLGLPDPGNVDLVQSSKAQRKPEDPGEFGTFYFRY